MRVVNKYKASPEELRTGVWIARGTVAGNPFVMGKDGTRDEVVAQFRDYAEKKILSKDARFLAFFSSLKESDILICYCKPKACHGDVIIELWNKYFKGKQMENNTQLIPSLDGVTHINVYSRGKTELGRLASNFAHTPFEHPEYGHFSSIEGFWYWLSTNKHQDDFRGLYGFKAKEAGRLLRKELEATGSVVEVNAFKAEIKKAILCKFEQNATLRKMLLESTLPLCHYYVYGEEPNVKIHQPSEYSWVHEYISDIRDYFRGKAQKLLIAGSREINDYEKVKQICQECIKNYPDFKPIEIVSGMARGVDTLATTLAKELELYVSEFPAKWKKEDGSVDRSAGIIRNRQMKDYATAAIVVWDGESSGSKDMFDQMVKANKPVQLFTINQTCGL